MLIPITTWLSSWQAKHPREWLPEAWDRRHLDRLRTGAAIQPFLASMREYANEAARTATPQLTFELFRQFARDGIRAAFDKTYHTRRGRLNALALTIVLDERLELLPALENEIWAICDEYTWALPAHLPAYSEEAARHDCPPEQLIDLFAADTALSMAEISVLLEDWLSPVVVDRMRSEVMRRVLDPFSVRAAPFPFELKTNNWAAVCAACVGAAALYMIHDPLRLAGIVSRVSRSLELYTDSFGDDGACPEGAGYWQYGFGYYVYFADMVYKGSQGRIHLLKAPKLARIASFTEALQMTGMEVVNFSDTKGRRTYQNGLLHRLPHYFPDSPTLQVGYTISFQADSCFRWFHNSRTLFWFDEEQAARKPVLPTKSCVYPDAQWFIDRRNHGEGLLTALAVKGGHNGEPHNHNDIGHFIVHAAGTTFLGDLGRGEYTRQYFSAERYLSDYCGSQGHSVPVIDGIYQSEGAQCRAAVLGYDYENDVKRVSLELCAAYPGCASLLSCVRTLEWRTLPYTAGNRTVTRSEEPAAVCELELTDRFEWCTRPATLTEHLIALVEPAAAGPGLIRLAGDHARLDISFDSQAWTVSWGPMENGGKSWRIAFDACEPANRHPFILVCRGYALAPENSANKQICSGKENDR